MEDICAIITSERATVIPAATQDEFVNRLREYESQPTAISGVLLDLMLTTRHGVTNWECLGFPMITFAPYLAGRQVLEIMRLPERHRTAPSFVKCFVDHPVAVLTAARDGVVFENIPKPLRGGIVVMYKDDDNSKEGTEPKLRAWIQSLPAVTEFSLLLAVRT